MLAKGIRTREVEQESATNLANIRGGEVCPTPPLIGETTGDAYEVVEVRDTSRTVPSNLGDEALDHVDRFLTFIKHHIVEVVSGTSSLTDSTSGLTITTRHGIIPRPEALTTAENTANTSSTRSDSAVESLFDAADDDVLGSGSSLLGRSRRPERTH